MGILRSFENMAFDRTLDKQSALFEVFVPKDYESEFVALMQVMHDRQVVLSFTCLPNRLLEGE